MDGWEDIGGFSQGYGVFAGDSDDGAQSPLAIFEDETYAHEFLRFLDTLPDDEQPMEPRMVLPMRKVSGEFWNSLCPVEWDGPNVFDQGDQA